jgi:primosomal protein N' (replication factor Y)
MHKAGVLINLPASRLNNIYSYRIPGHWLDKAGVGKRVLVDFAGKINEAFIIDINESNDDLPALKEIIAILDDEPLFDEKMLSLAYWMAEYYVCPLPVAIHLMIPPLLHRHKPRYVLPNISEDRLWERFDDDHSLDDKFFAHLHQRQKLSWTEAQKFARPENLRRWEAQGLIIIVGSYHVTRSIKEGQVYIAGKFDYELELEPLRKKAPRQAEIMTLLWEKGEIARPQLEQRYSPGIINSLLGKGYIRIGKRTNSVEPCRLHLNQEQNEAINAINRALCSGNHKDFYCTVSRAAGKRRYTCKLRRSA